ncbi:YkgJ family cysteine cluster protein [Duganella sp. FT80W]|uniref:YkgJ family cysteine cluster protein n=1 Tax=Duganella guangzhouensis TaxID=2666084 RepID=A0A6I2LA46_9BURK|nr:YkgJ family cysteine cluster protein [Duganella guangzhouensis]MRW94680.1 YkgJ family cysteine cluster protein [Duganella guangzhouensis]
MNFDCQSCGACCAVFRVSFYWSETTLHPAGTVPQELVTPISPHHVAMKGTLQTPVRCVALCGEVGDAVSCAIYPSRSSTCREVQAGDERCLRARELAGLQLPA